MISCSLDSELLLVLQLVWVCQPGNKYYLPLHILLLLRLCRMQHVFLLMKVGPSCLALVQTTLAIAAYLLVFGDTF